MKGYDEGTVKSKLERRDSASWQPKSWIIGISLRGKSRAYDWNDLIKERMISDSLDGTRLLLTIEPNNKTYYVFNRLWGGQVLQFVGGASNGIMMDTQTRSIWQPNGLCIDGPLKGGQLLHPQAYQEFWHSWKYFHPNTTTYKKIK